MKFHQATTGIAFLSLLCGSIAFAQSSQQSAPVAVLVQGTLVESGSPPFHLKAQIAEERDAPGTFIEIHWLEPDRWRRTIQSAEFSQTIVMNGNKVFEQDSQMYMPPEIATLLAAMTDPRQIIAALQPGDIVWTKANGISQESGAICLSPGRMCLGTALGLMESVGAQGHRLDFTDYQKFHEKRIARRLTHTISVGDFYTAQITELEDLKSEDYGLFTVAEPTPPQKRLRVEILGEEELRSLATEAPDIVRPQVLDGTVTGNSSFSVSLDTEGKVRDVQVLESANERSNDSAIRQIMRWKFKPATRDGFPVQAEGTLNFDVNTRAAGPKDVLSDAEARKLASNIVEPVVPAGSVPPGAVYKIWIAVDADGFVIEKIVYQAPHGVDFGTVDQALRQWQFKPLMMNGKPQPYRALLELHLQTSP